jgi:uncharacterized protein (TIGR03435 family)
MKLIILPLAMAMATHAQTPTPEQQAEFEVASIHVAQQDGNQDSDVNNPLVRIHNYTLKRLIARAWEVDTSLISGGPSWVDSESYDVNAKIPAELVHRSEKFPEMMQRLLVERFHLVIHREPREISGYALIVKGTPRLEKATGDLKDSSMNSHNSSLKAQNVTMESFARYLSRNRDVAKLVADKTGLTGGFNFEMTWTAERLESDTPAGDDDRASIFTALQEQLGLRLQSSKIPAQAVIIDRAEKPEEN